MASGRELDPFAIELWRGIPDYPGYLASSHGRVANRISGFLVGRRGTDGRRKLKLSNEDGLLDRYAHQCVAKAFWPSFEWGDPVGHFDGDVTNNRIENLDHKVWQMPPILKSEYIYLERWKQWRKIRN